MPYMVAPIGRKPIQSPPPPKPEEKKVASDAEQLTQLLGDIGKKLETAWNNAINPPPGAVQQDPLLRFLSEFTNTPLAKVEAPAAQTVKADAEKIAQRQAQKKDSLGFSVSEPEAAPKKDETPVEPQQPGEIAQPTKEFTQTAARIYAAREDGVATKAEAGALIYSMAQEIKLAKAAGVPQDEISKTMGRMLGEFRIGVALSDDLMAASESIAMQVGFISLMGDNPEAYEKLGLSLLGGKPPEPVKVPPPPEVIIPGSNMQEGGGGGGGVQFVMGANGQPVSLEQQYARIHPNPNQNQTVTDTRLRQDQLRRTEERRREDAENAGNGGGGVDTQVQQQQLLYQQDLIRQQQDQQRLQDQLRQMEDQQRRDDENRRRR